ncbi:NPCBM/NEW2 domain protein [Maioricimonas rarisocia]|uniref:NPCBM/NEW2 domain protein n=1 Tax=Maioricimonas rarisocia TaxID=2528026 RepID=A0A517ZDD0_9PLAN|nr:NPCBM/NEW2 domain-containing protein [Maioricimonas rarisocia]QDU40494.1 NPCBM/NEW2 domain protein [Maioricimonas rarisocia]
MVSCRSFSDSARALLVAAVLLTRLTFTPSVGRADDAAASDCTVLAVDGAQIHGELSRIDGESVHLSGQQTAETVLPLDSVIALRMMKPPAAPPESPGQWLLFANGDRVAAEAVRFDGEEILTRPAALLAVDEWRVPVEMLAAVTWSQKGTAPERLETRLRGDGLREDLLLLTNGDRVTGELLTFDEQNVAIETSVGEIPIERSRLAGLAFNPDLVVPPSTPSQGAVIGFHDGGRMTVRSVRLDGAVRTFEVEPLFGAALRLPIDAVSMIELVRPGLRSLAVVDVSDVTVEQTPYLSSAPSPVWNGNVAGGALRLRGMTCPRGVGMLSGTSLTFRVQSGDEAFLAVVGIDDAADGQGSARFSVLLDGGEVWSSGELTGQNEPVVVGPLDVAGANRLTLRVDFGEYGDIRDFADWCTPVIVRTQAK